jgi:hypothetical protein
LLSVETDDESLEILRSRQGEISEDLIHVMGDLADQLRDRGDDLAAQRLDVLRGEAEQLIS